MGDDISWSHRLALFIIGVPALIISAPLALVMLYPWRDPMGPKATWAVVAAYAVAGAVAWAVFG